MSADRPWSSGWLRTARAPLWYVDLRGVSMCRHGRSAPRGEPNAAEPRKHFSQNVSTRPSAHATWSPGSSHDVPLDVTASTGDQCDRGAERSRRAWRPGQTRSPLGMVTRAHAPPAGRAARPPASLCCSTIGTPNTSLGWSPDGLPGLHPAHVRSTPRPKADCLDTSFPRAEHRPCSGATPMPD